MTTSRISGLHRLSVVERIDKLTQLGFLTGADAELLRQGRQVLLPGAADKMIENVIGVHGLPLAIAPNFLLNGRDYIVPMVVEEPSVVAALSNAARLARTGGGFSTNCEERLLAGQVHMTGISEPAAAQAALEAEKHMLMAAANDVHPRLRNRGGGVRDIEIRPLELPDASPAIEVRFLVDTKDAMGANLVNTICEEMAPKIAALCDGNVALCIVSNFADRSLVNATVRIRLQELGTADHAAEAVRDRIVTASDIACVDAHRAATHNKGIMNGIDAVAIATGNDWRAVEAGAHAYAAKSGSYLPLSTWSVDANGDLLGHIQLPLTVGIVGGTLVANSAAAMALRITGAETSAELAELMAAVGLAQNLAALRALASSGIQEGHMRLHARHSAAAAGTRTRMPVAEKPASSAAGKVILLGEHAVVYGKHAVALPIINAVTAEITSGHADLSLTIPEWGVHQTIVAETPVTAGIDQAVLTILHELGIDPGGYAIRLQSALPRGMGLGSSAALAVAIVRAFDALLNLGLDDAQVNEIAFACEKLAHGTPSGIDNTVSTYAVPVLFRNTEPPQTERLTLQEPPPIVIGCSRQAGSTKQQVENVRARRKRHPAHYDVLFDEIDALSLAGAAALQEADYEELGALMNVCHGLLNALQVSTPEIEGMVGIARSAGALGAKITGGGGGGSMIALCPTSASEVADALAAAGFETMLLAEQG